MNTRKIKIESRDSIIVLSTTYFCLEKLKARLKCRKLYGMLNSSSGTGGRLLLRRSSATTHDHLGRFQIILYWMLCLYVLCSFPEYLASSFL